MLKSKTKTVLIIIIIAILIISVILINPFKRGALIDEQFPDADSLLEAIANGDKPDLILMDTDMPGIKGYEACDRIKNNENTKDIKIIGVSGNITDSYEQKWREARGDHFISKPFDLDNLLNKTKELLGE